MKSNKLIQDRDILVWLLKTAKKQFPAILLSIFVNAGFAGCSVIFALACRNVINAASAFEQTTFLFHIFILFSIIIIQLLLRFWKRWLEEHNKAKLDILYKDCIFHTLLQKEYAQITQYHSGELLNRLFSDVRVISEGAATFLPSLAEMITLLFAATFVLIQFDPIFTLLFIAGGIILFCLTRVFRKKMKQLHKHMQEKEGKVRSFLQEVIESLLVIKVFDIATSIEEQNTELQKNLYYAKMRRCNLSILANTGFSFLFQMGYFYALLWGSWQLLTSHMNFGTLTALLQLVRQLQQPFANISGFLPRYYAIIASAERLHEIIDLPNEQGDYDEIEPLKRYENLDGICFDRISFAYQQEEILTDASLFIQKHDFVAIEGVSGIGKSTLLKLLLDVYHPQSGSIYFIEKDQTHYVADCSTRGLFSYVPQGNYLFSGSIRENITLLQPKATEDIIQRALHLSCSEHFIKELPEGIDTQIKEKGMRLSEGQVQRLAIARALLSSHPILLLDEATSALDEQTEVQLLQNLKTMEHITLLIVTHKKAASAICNKHIYIDKKKIKCKENKCETPK